MFTGIVEAIGTVQAVRETNLGKVFTVEAPDIASELEIGASIAVNGTCLTAVDFDDRTFVVEAVAETLAKTSLGTLVTGQHVNLERPLAASGRFDGHIVQGHVDGTAAVVDVRPEGDGARLTIGIPRGLARYVVEKGSITVDGVSLTVAHLDEETFQIAVIPHTLDVTVLGQKAPGDVVNLEVDVIAKYVERMMKENR